MNKAEMIATCEWLGSYVAYHQIGPYSFVEYHPRVVVGSVLTKEINYETTQFSAFVDGDTSSRSYGDLDSALAGAIAYRHEGCNHRADVYFIRSLQSDPPPVG